jgi:hypothetical protein
VADLIPGIGAGRILESQLLSADRAIRIGAVHRMDYTRAIVLTHDRWKFTAAGIPQFCFLLATARDVTAPGGDDDEVLLLRVEGAASLSMEADLHAVREESLRDALSASSDMTPRAVLDVPLDPFTKNRMAFTGLECRILGTFYEERRDGQVELEWGHDVDNFYATATYQVFKPLAAGLSVIASYLKPAPGEPVDRVRIGAVRYSSTRRRAVTANQHDAAVTVNVHDFIGHKTGMFGMTRMGKSNTMKTVIARTFAASEQARKSDAPPVGQLIFDPQGEYANPNTQDGTEIAAIGPSHVTIYKFGADGGQQHVKPLGFNFFDANQAQATQNMMASVLADATSDYIRAFVAADYAGLRRDGEPDSEFYPRKAAAANGRLLLYAALTKAEFQIPHSDPAGNRWLAWVNMRAGLADAIQEKFGAHVLRRPTPSKGWVGITPEAVQDITDWLIEQSGSDTRVDGLKEFTKGDAWKSALPIYTQTNGGRAVSGYTKLKQLRVFHSTHAGRDYRAEIYRELTQGKIVIVDLHLGPARVTGTLAGDCANYLIEQQTEAFTTGSVPPRIQVVIEEAHNLFTNDKYKDDLDVWVRLAKEASKLHIGMIYATQEVTGVAHQVLANTKNWVVAHLNNRREVAELSKYYDFQAFGEAIISAEDKGYVRLKTMSSPYIVPVQIDRYGVDLVNQARAAAGDAPLQEQR